MQDRFLVPATWAALPVDRITPLYPNGQELLTGTALSEAVYTPLSKIPEVVVFRTSDREKRLEGDLLHSLLKSGEWGTLHEVTGAGSHVGFVLTPAPGYFEGASCMPDNLHLMKRTSLMVEHAKTVHNHKMLKFFSFDCDLYVVTKSRWFRSRNNPKYLGFSKDEK